MRALRRQEARRAGRSAEDGTEAKRTCSFCCCIMLFIIIICIMSVLAAGGAGAGACWMTVVGAAIVRGFYGLAKV